MKNESKVLAVLIVTNIVYNDPMIQWFLQYFTGWGDKQEDGSLDGKWVSKTVTYGVFNTWVFTNTLPALKTFFTIVLNLNKNRNINWHKVYVINVFNYSFVIIPVYLFNFNYKRHCRLKSHLLVWMLFSSFFTYKELLNHTFKFLRTLTLYI